MALPRGPSLGDCRIGCFWLTYLVGQRPTRLLVFLSEFLVGGQPPRHSLTALGPKPERRLNLRVQEWLAASFELGKELLEAAQHVRRHECDRRRERSYWHRWSRGDGRKCRGNSLA